MINKLIVISGLIISILLLSGCIDVDDYEGCKKSYDNLILNYGYVIKDHSSSFVSGAENTYFISYYICKEYNGSSCIWLYDFIYNTELDELSYTGDSDIVERILN